MVGPVVILGAGALGGYAGAFLSLAGEDVVLADAFPAHVEAIRAGGLRVDGPDGSHLARPRALHLGEIHGLRHAPVRLVVLCVKLYDTAWAARLVRDALPPGAPVLTLQNALVEETVAAAVGWPRVLGGIATGMNVALAGPGHVRRASRRFGETPVLKAGEPSGRVTPRLAAIVELLGKVDTAGATTTLWNDRWLKLCINAMTSGLGGIAGLPLDHVHGRGDTRAIAVRLGAEAVAVGRAHGFDPGPVFGLAPDRWIAAGAGDADAAREADAAFSVAAARVEPGFRSGTLQDLERGRRTEVDFLNGTVEDLGRQAGVPAPTHAWVRRTVHEIEAGRRAPSPDNLAEAPA